MTRQNGFYWVKTSDNKWTIAEYIDSLWFFAGISRGEEGFDSFYDHEPIEIDETPILRPQLQKIHSTSQTLATLKETLAYFPDTLLVSEVRIIMHNKYSIQITEYYAEQKEGN